MDIVEKILRKTNPERFLILHPDSTISEYKRLLYSKLRSFCGCGIKSIVTDIDYVLFDQMLLTMVDPRIIKELSSRNMKNVKLLTFIEHTLEYSGILTYYPFVGLVEPFFYVYIEAQYDVILSYILEDPPIPRELKKTIVDISRTISIVDWLKKRFSKQLNTGDNNIEETDLISAYINLKHNNGVRENVGVVIIGAGGVGWWTAEYLVAHLKNSEIWVFDFDEIEPHNFNRLPLSYDVLYGDELKKVFLLERKLKEIAEYNRNSLVPIPTAFDLKSLEIIKGLRERYDVVYVVEATDSPRFQLLIRKWLREMNLDNIYLIQAHYDLPNPTGTLLDVFELQGMVEGWGNEIPAPSEKEVEEAGDYAEGQSIGLPAWLVGHTVSLLIQSKLLERGKNVKVGPYILSLQQLIAFKDGILI